MKKLKYLALLAIVVPVAIVLTACGASTTTLANFIERFETSTNWVISMEMKMPSLMMGLSEGEEIPEYVIITNVVERNGNTFRNYMNMGGEFAMETIKTVSGTTVTIFEREGGMNQEETPAFVWGQWEQDTQTFATNDEALEWVFGGDEDEGFIGAIDVSDFTRSGNVYTFTGEMFDMGEVDFDEVTITILDANRVRMNMLSVEMEIDEDLMIEVSAVATIRIGGSTVVAPTV